MLIWIDLANSPHVPFFRPLANEFTRRGHEVIVTARQFAETVPLAEAAGFAAQVIGGHGGAKLSRKAGNLVGRGLDLARWARGKQIALAVSHNSYSQILAARALSLRSVTLMDYEHQPANHLAFRLASRVIVPRAFPKTSLTRFGVPSAKVKRYDGIKEDVYLATFVADQNFAAELQKLGINAGDILVTARPPASEALYHRFENQLFDQLLARLLGVPAVKLVLLPRNESQGQYYAREKIIIPAHPLDGANLIACSDLVVSAGGTMNREAAALGVPAASIYQGEWAAIDQQLVAEGRLQRIATEADVRALRIEKKTTTSARSGTDVLQQVANLILEA
jgi:predicted glycosyltransferase